MTLTNLTKSYLKTIGNITRIETTLTLTRDLKTRSELQAAILKHQAIAKRTDLKRHEIFLKLTEHMNKSQLITESQKRYA